MFAIPMNYYCLQRRYCLILVWGRYLSRGQAQVRVGCRRVASWTRKRGRPSRALPDSTRKRGLGTRTDRFRTDRTGCKLVTAPSSPPSTILGCPHASCFPGSRIRAAVHCMRSNPSSRVCWPTHLVHSGHHSPSLSVFSSLFVVFSLGISIGLQLEHRCLYPSQRNVRRFTLRGTEKQLPGGLSRPPSWCLLILIGPQTALTLSRHITFRSIVRTYSGFCILVALTNDTIPSNYIFPFIIPAGPDPKAVS
jgi:hypothetical protein